MDGNYSIRRTTEYLRSLMHEDIKTPDRQVMVRTLPTGDLLIEQHGVQHLLLPNKGALIISSSGMAMLTGSGTVCQATYKDGVSTIVFSDGEYVRFDCWGIFAVVRGDRIAILRPALIPPEQSRTPKQAA